MSATRSRKDHRRYKRYQQNRGAGGDCIFCEMNENTEQILEQTEHFKIIRNIFAYSRWDEQSVTDHLLVAPKQHTDTLKDLTPLESQEFVRIITDYEDQGYNIYARAPGSNMKSIVHQHTHLIKTAGKLKKSVVNNVATKIIKKLKH